MTIEELFPDGYVISCPLCGGDTWYLSFADSNIALGEYEDWTGLVQMKCQNPECVGIRTVFMDTELNFWADIAELFDEVS